MAISSRGTVVLATGLLVAAAVCAAAAAAPLPRSLSRPRPSATKNDTSLSHYFYVDSCPQLETIVRSTVDNAIRQDVRLTAGLLRIFFHDCFPQVNLFAA